MRYIGIDPGVSGAIAVWRPYDRHIALIPMPVMKIKRGRSVKRTVDVHTLVRELSAIDAVTNAVIEQAGARPNEGVASAHANGRNWGVLYGIAVSLGWPVTIVPARAWKSAMRCPADKDGARLRASQLLPEYAHLWAAKKDDGLAEAALMAVLAGEDVSWAANVRS